MRKDWKIYTLPGTARYVEKCRHESEMSEMQEIPELRGRTEMLEMPAL